MKSFFLVTMWSTGLFFSEISASHSKNSKGAVSTSVKPEFDSLAEVKAMKDDLQTMLGKIDTNFQKMGEAGKKMGDSMKKLGDSVDNMVHTDNVINDAHDKSLAELLSSIAVLLNLKLSQTRPDITDKERLTLSKNYVFLTNLIFGDVNIADLDAIGRIVWHENQKMSTGYRQKPKSVVDVRRQEAQHHAPEGEEYYEPIPEEEDESLVPGQPRGVGFSEFAGKIFRPVADMFSSFFGTPKTKDEQRIELAAEVLKKYNKLARAYPDIEKDQKNFRQDLKHMNLQQLQDIDKAIDEFYTYNYDEDFYGNGDEYEEFY